MWRATVPARSTSGCADILKATATATATSLTRLGDCGGPCDADRLRWHQDDEDPCVGELDECGVVTVWRDLRLRLSDIIEGDCDWDGNQLDALGSVRWVLVTRMSTQMASVTTKTLVWRTRRMWRVHLSRRDLRLRLCGHHWATAIAMEISSTLWGCVAFDAECRWHSDEDPCVGELDECGVCNGPRHLRLRLSDIIEGDRDCDGNQLDALSVWRSSTRMSTRWHL